jgi:EpsD family peptidyl-prolyl cis-trans isomerase
MFDWLATLPRIWRAVSVCALVCTLSLTGCGKKASDNNGATQTGQVIARVGNDDITAQELENEFRLANVPPDKRSDAITKRVLGEIVVRKYLVQQALAAKLDREPTVHLDIMRSREQVLAGALAQRTLASKASSIGKSEIDQFIGAHPSQFGKRKILNIEQINMPISADTKSVVDATKAFKTLDQVDQKLKEMGISHTRSTGVLDSANISDEFLTALQAKKDDDIFFVRNGSNGTFFKVTSEQSQPLTGDEAANRARQLMQMDILKAAGAQAAQAGEASAKFEGDYARIMENHATGSETTPAKN